MNFSFYFTLKSFPALTDKEREKERERERERGGGRARRESTPLQPTKLQPA